MADRMISLRAELVDRLEQLAEQQGRGVDDVVGDLLRLYAPTPSGNWAQAVVDAMADPDIEWLDEPDASERSREHFKRHLDEKWLRGQEADSDDR